MTSTYYWKKKGVEEDTTPPHLPTLPTNSPNSDIRGAPCAGQEENHTEQWDIVILGDRGDIITLVVTANVLFLQQEEDYTHSEIQLPILGYLRGYVPRHMYATIRVGNTYLVMEGGDVLAILVPPPLSHHHSHHPTLLLHSGEKDGVLFREEGVYDVAPSLLGGSDQWYPPIHKAEEADNDQETTEEVS